MLWDLRRARLAKTVLHSLAHQTCTERNLTCRHRRTTQTRSMACRLLQQSHPKTSTENPSTGHHSVRHTIVSVVGKLRKVRKKGTVNLIRHTPRRGLIRSQP